LAGSNNNNNSNKEQVILDERQVTLDEWLVRLLRDKLRKYSLLASRTGKPIVLYQNTIEETDHSAEEEVATINEKYVIIQVFIHGGFIPPIFQQQYVFTLDEFPTWIMKRSRDLLLQCLDN
jgi:hypothetical protein